jgi:hypothetical protein
MKWKTTLGMALLGAMFFMPAWAHHAADGIISDDIWNNIDGMLQDTPHVDVTFGNAMNSMRVDEAPGGGGMFLVSSITIDAEDLDLYMDAIDVVMDAIRDNNGDPNGAYSNTYLPVFVDPICDDTVCKIVLYEPIGSVGWTEDAEEVYDPPEAPGPSAQQGKRGK